MEDIDYGNKNSFQKLVDKIKSKLASVALSGKYSDLTGKPTSMKNPSALTFTGGVTGSYDGSAAKTVNIPTTLPASNTTSDYSATGTAPVNGTAVNKALQTLDVASKGGSGKYIQAISETDGKISATEATMPTIPVAVAVKGNAEATYRTGNVNLTPANVGAMPYNSSIANGTDLNTMTDQGFYFKVGGVSIVNGPEGYPVANGLGLAVVRIANSITAQFVFGYSSDTNVKIYFRRGNSNSWSDWGSTGSVSENDATYVKKTGGTITGNLTVKGAGMGYYSASPDNSQSVWFGVASNKSYRGLWDKVLQQYFAALDANNELILGINTPTQIKDIASFRRSTGQGCYLGTSGTAGWVVIAQIKINSAYVNNTIELEVAGHGRSMIAHLYIMFKSVESHDPGLDVFLCYGQQNSNSIYRLKKTATSTWQLAAQKNEAYGSIYIASVHSAQEYYDGGVSITYPNKQLATAPDSTWIAPTWYGKIGSAVNADNADALSNFILTSSAAISDRDTKWGGIGYAKVDAGTFGPGTNSIVDCALYKQRYSDLWEARIYQDYRTGRLAVKGKKDGTWQPTRLIPIADIYENMQLQGTLVLSKATDASGTADNKPALIVGGLSTGEHLELDPNEIMAKANGTTPSILNLNHDGGLVSIGSGGLKSRGNIIATDLYGIYVGSKYYNIIKAFDDGETANNGLQGIVQFGGNVFIGGGEAPTNLYNAYQTAGNLLAGESYGKTGERLYLCSDSGMYLMVNCNTIGDRTGIILGSIDSDHKVFVRPISDLKGDLGHSNHFWRNAYLNKIISKLVTATYLAGNQGNAIINSLAAAGSYVMLAKMNTTDGYMTIGTYQKQFLLCYTAKATVDAGSNTITKAATLLDENGNSSFPGEVTSIKFIAEKFSSPTGSAGGVRSCAFGYKTITSGTNAHAEGEETRANGENSHAEGKLTYAIGSHSHAEGLSTTANGAYSHAGGAYTTASNVASRAIGHYNASMTGGGSVTNTAGTAFCIGKGTATGALSNAFSVQYTGVVKASSTITASTAADYAEYFEWEDGNKNFEDRVGLFVTIKGEKIQIANKNDEYILGIVSGEPFVLGNGDCDTWNGMYLRDDFGRTLYEQAPYFKENKETGELEQQFDEEGNVLYYGTRPVLNPDYDPNEPYVPRSDRPEWAAIGMLGVLSLKQDGSILVPNVYCTVGENGRATFSLSGGLNCYRVIKVVSSEIVKVIFR